MLHLCGSWQLPVRGLWMRSLCGAGVWAVFGLCANVPEVVLRYWVFACGR